MQFDDFDSKVRQAADQHHPNYDENAWSKMQKLLDQHLPVKKDRDRRFIFLLFLFLLAGGGVWLMFSKPWQQKNKIVSVSTNQDKAVAKKPAATPDANETHAPAVSNVPVKSAQPGEPVTAQSQKNNVDDNSNVVSDSKHPTASPQKSKGERNQALNGTTTGTVNNRSSKQNNLQPGKNKRNNQPTIIVAAPVNTAKGNNVVPDKQDLSLSTSNDNNVKNNDVAAKPDENKTQPAQASPADNEPKNKTEEEKKDKAEPVTADKKDVAKKAGKQKSNYLFFSFGVAPDLSYISLDQPGKVKLLSGAGFGYTFNNRWTIRTGFYAGRKIYTANKYNYKPDNPGPTNNLEKIDADCKVYEVPLSVAYNFSNAKKHSFFGSLGLSSFFMKREEYQYLYKYPGPPVTTYVHTKELYNENKHYFSVLTLSAGYERRLNKTFSLSAEPYVNLPLAGIGYGHVKLNSMGVLFSLNVTPFHH